MAYLPPPGPGGSAAPQGSLGLAAVVGVVIAIPTALVVGVLSGLTNIQFAYGAILIGYLVGAGMRRFRRDAQTAITCAVISVAGSALSSVIAACTYLVKGHGVPGVPLRVVLANMSIVFSGLPRYIGFLGFLFWALAAYVGWATISGRGRRSRLGGFRGRRYGMGQQQPYGATGPQPYGTPVGPGQPGYAPHQAYLPGQPPYGAPGTPGQPDSGTGPGFGSPSDFGSGPGFGSPSDFGSGSGFDSPSDFGSGPGFGGPPDQPTPPPAG